MHLVTATLRVSSLCLAALISCFFPASLSLADSLAWRYNHAGAPEQFSQAEMENLVREALSAWAPCGVGHYYVGTTTKTTPSHGEVIVRWDGQPNYSYGHFNGMLNKKTGRPFYGTVTLYASQLSYKPENLRAIMLHEVGHAQGLNYHDQWASGIMYPHPKPTARVTTDDIARCKLPANAR